MPQHSSPGQPPEPPLASPPRSDGLPAVSPDEREQELTDLIDNIVPTRGYQMRPMVALGGSAGSIPAIQAFLQATPPETGMAFVVILHLDPERESTLADALQSSTRMPVRRAEDSEKTQPNTVYVIPPGKHLTVVDEWLHLTPLLHETGRRVAVDLFFR